MNRTCLIALGPKIQRSKGKKRTYSEAIAAIRDDATQPNVFGMARPKMSLIGFNYPKAVKKLLLFAWPPGAWFAKEH